MSMFTRIGRRDPFHLVEDDEPLDMPRARLLIDHPAASIPWTIDRSNEVPGFYHLSTKILLTYSVDSEIKVKFTVFNLISHESDFQRIH